MICYFIDYYIGSYILITLMYIYLSDQSLGAVRVFEPFIEDPCAIRTRVQNAAQLLVLCNFRDVFFIRQTISRNTLKMN
jgi:hypothetical protein